MPDNSYYTQLQQAIDRLEHLKGQPLLDQIHSIITLAKSHDDNNAVADFARHLIRAGSHEGRLDYEMIGFGELQSLYERNPNYADLRAEILWYYKWLAERLPEYVEVPADRVDGFLDQMEAFYRAAGEGLRPVYELRCRAAAFMGREDDARRLADLWQSTPKADSDNCPACETHSRVQYLLDVGEIPEAVDAAKPILEGEQHCEEVPSTTFSRLLIPLLFTTQSPETSLYLASVVRRHVRHTAALLSHLADHVNLLALLGLFDDARRNLVVLLAHSRDSNNAFVQFCASRSAWLCLARMAKSEIPTIRFPPRTGDLAGRTLRTPDAAAHFRTRTIALADSFDRRHNTPRFAQRTEAIEKLASL
jgi:hypothetical protein